MSSAIHQSEVSELVLRCAARPVDESAWSEFVRRFHPVIRTSVSSVHARLSWTESGSEGSSEDKIHDMVQEVYRRLTENGGAALKRVKCTNSDSMKNYLLLIAINVVRDQLRGKTPSVSVAKPSPRRSTDVFRSGEFAIAKML